MHLTRPAVAVGGCLAVLFVSSCGPLANGFCDTPGCLYSKEEWKRVSSLANLPDPPPDPSNQYVGNASAEALGHKFYFDPFFSGTANHLDMLARSTQYGRADVGQPIHVSCNTCHDVLRGGADVTSEPGNVSVGAGMYDVNGQQTFNAAQFPLLYWNGRSDSLWAQAAGVTESSVSMNGGRLGVAWRIADAYAADYNSLFGAQYPFPLTGTRQQLNNALAGDGQCRLVTVGATAGVCPSNCVQETNDEVPGCWPRFPLEGKRGTVAGCQRNDPYEPARDAFDCMLPDDQTLIARVFVNYAKAIAAYEYKLVSRNSPFDQFVAAGAGSSAISDSAKRGAQLFVGKASCIDCHSTPLLSDGTFHNIGVPQGAPPVPTQNDCTPDTPCDCPDGINCLPWGAFDGLSKLSAIPAFHKLSGPNPSFPPADWAALTTGADGLLSVEFRRDTPYSDAPTDVSRARFYGGNPDPALKGAWRTPTLRDVDLTAPYMHNGIFRTLEDVVWHYNHGAPAGGALVGSKDPRIHPLDLSDAEAADLVEFLRTLTGQPLDPSLTAKPVIPEEQPL